MSIQQPTSSDRLNSPDHSKSHRVFANDDSAPVKKVTVDADGNTYVGDYEGGNRTKIDSDGVVTLEGTAKRWLVLRPEINQDEVRKVLKPDLLQRGVFFGYSMPVYDTDNEELFFKQEVPGRWDGISNFRIHLTVALTGTEDIGDKFQFQLSWQHGSTGNVVSDATHDVTAETTVLTARNAAYDAYEIFFTFDYDIDGGGNEVQAGELIAMRLRRIAASSLEVTNEIIVLNWDVHYQVDKMFKAQ